MRSWIRIVVAVAVLGFSAFAQVAHAQTVRTITGNPLTVRVGSDMSFQVFTTLVPGSGQFYPNDSTGTADAGVFARMGGVLYSPNFTAHGTTATSSIGAHTPWTEVSISPVTGSGTSADPFTVVVVGDAAATGLRLTMTVTYVNGDNFYRENLAFSSTSGAQTFDTFLAGDIYLANSDSGIPFSQGGAVGGQTCSPPLFTILLIPQVPAAADRFTATGYNSVWAQIGTGTLNNTISPGCQDNGAALQWQGRTISGTGGSVTIAAATSFGAIPTIVGGAPSNLPVPTMSEWMMVVMALLIAGMALYQLRRGRS